MITINKLSIPYKFIWCRKWCSACVVQKVTYSTGNMAITYAHNTTNLTPTNFLGLAGEAISDGGSGKITILGGVTSQSSLQQVNLIILLKMLQVKHSSRY